MRSTILLITALLVLILVNFNIYQREQLITNGRVVLLELAPVDPRSLMQGDYMALRFQVANDAFNRNMEEDQTDGHIIVTLDEKKVANFVRFAESKELAENELRLRYRIRNGRAMFATNAFFFQEGHARKYQNARYGEFRVAADGEMILTQMRDKDLAVLGKNRA